MTRRRYIQDPQTLELVEVTSDYSATRNDAKNRVHGDLHYDGLRAPDGTDISTRTKHREYMRATGLTTADDFSSSWSKAKEQRQNYMQRGGSVSRSDIQQAIAKLKGY